MWRDREECVKIRRGSVRGERKEVEIVFQNYRNVFMSIETERERVCVYVYVSEERHKRTRTGSGED